MYGLIAASADTSAWTYGASILSFAFPMLLFVVVAAWLYVTYTKPELVPGHRNPAIERPIIHTLVPGPPPRRRRREQGQDRGWRVTSTAAVSGSTPGTLDHGPAGRPDGGRRQREWWFARWSR